MVPLPATLPQCLSSVVCHMVLLWALFYLNCNYVFFFLCVLLLSLRLCSSSVLFTVNKSGPAQEAIHLFQPMSQFCPGSFVPVKFLHPFPCSLFSAAHNALGYLFTTTRHSPWLLCNTHRVAVSVFSSQTQAFYILSDYWFWDFALMCFVFGSPACLHCQELHCALVFSLLDSVCMNSQYAFSASWAIISFICMHPADLLCVSALGSCQLNWTRILLSTVLWCHMQRCRSLFSFDYLFLSTLLIYCLPLYVAKHLWIV